MNTLKKFELEQIRKHVENKDIPDFQPGDTVRVNVRIVEGNKERVQAYEGICISRKNRGINSSFTVRKIASGEGVERIFPLYSPRIDSIKLVRRGDVRRAKLYYMRGLSGKAARIREKRDFSAATAKEALPVEGPKVEEKTASEETKPANESNKEAKPEAKKEAEKKPAKKEGKKDNAEKKEAKSKNGAKSEEPKDSD